MTSHAAIERSTWPANAPRVVAVRAFAWRDALLARRAPVELGLELVFGILNLLIYYFISRTLGGGTADLGSASSYFDFAVVGIALTVVIQVATMRLAQRVREDRLTGTLEAILAQPVSVREIAIGMACFHFAFAAVRAALYLGVAGLFLGLELGKADWLGFALVLALTAVAMGGVAIALAAFVLYVRRGEALGGVLTMALALGGGAYFPISSLPNWAEPVAHVLPTRFAYDGLRSALYAGTGWADSLAWLSLYAAIGLPLAIVLFGRALAYARSHGSLTFQ